MYPKDSMATEHESIMSIMSTQCSTIVTTKWVSSWLQDTEVQIEGKHSKHQNFRSCHRRKATSPIASLFSRVWTHHCGFKTIFPDHPGWIAIFWKEVLVCPSDALSSSCVVCFSAFARMEITNGFPVLVGMSLCLPQHLSGDKRRPFESWFSFSTVWGWEIRLGSAGAFTYWAIFSNPKLCNLKTAIKRQNCTSLFVNVGVWDLIKCRFVGLNETFRVRSSLRGTVVWVISWQKPRVL